MNEVELVEHLILQIIPLIVCFAESLDRSGILTVDKQDFSRYLLHTNIFEALLDIKEIEIFVKDIFAGFVLQMIGAGQSEVFDDLSCKLNANVQALSTQQPTLTLNLTSLSLLCMT